MKTMLLAAVLAVTAGIGGAFASVTVYSDGTTFDNSPVATVAHKDAGNMCSVPMQTTAQFSAGNPKVVRFGPPDAGTFGTNG